MKIGDKVRIVMSQKAINELGTEFAAVWNGYEAEVVELDPEVHEGANGLNGLTGLLPAYEPRPDNTPYQGVFYWDTPELQVV